MGSLVADLERDLQKDHRVFLFLDYDGTITPIVETPEDAVLDEDTKELLARLVGVGQIDLVVVSGRAIDDLRQMTGEVPGLRMIGNHGFDSEGGEIPDSSGLEETIRVYGEKLKSMEEKYPGLLLEYKKVALSVHYRKVDSQKAADLMPEFFVWWLENGDPDNFMVMAGKKVFEIKPRKINKGTAVLKMIDELRETESKSARRYIYIGDDITDEDAFRELRKFSGGKAYTVAVGEARPTRARYRVDEIEQVKTVLRKIIEIMAN